MVGLCPEMSHFTVLPERRLMRFPKKIWAQCWELPFRDIWDGASGHTDINKRKKQEVRLGDQLSLMILF